MERVPERSRGCPVIVVNLPESSAAVAKGVLHLPGCSAVPPRRIVNMYQNVND